MPTHALHPQELLSSTNRRASERHRAFAAVFLLGCLSAACNEESQFVDVDRDPAATGGETDDIDAGQSTGYEDEETGEEALEPGLSLSAEEDPIAVTGSNRINDADVNPRWPEVVAVGNNGGNCSGTLISPVHVLTAGHCGPGVSVRLDTPAGSGTGTADRRQYTVIQTQLLSSTPFTGQDIELLLLDRAVPSFGIEGSPEYAVAPAFALAAMSSSTSAWTVGYGRDCGGSAYGSRRGLLYNGGFTQYGAFPGVITRNNLGCVNPAYEGPNLGDSGGPLLDVAGRVVGVFSGWSCRNAAGVIGAPGCTGTIEWSGFSSANVAWLNAAIDSDFDGDGVMDRDDPRPGLNCTGASPPAACADLLPDLEIIDVRSGGCSGSGGNPMASVTIRNNGPVAAKGWVDVFVDQPSPPAIGTYSSVYRMSNTLSQGETQTMSFEVTPTNNPTWVDVLADTTRTVTELDESNNHRDAYVTFPDCSFG